MSRIAQLFRWHTKVEVKEGGKVLETVFIRLVGDTEFQEARTVALKQSKLMRIAMRDKSADEHQANFSDIDSLTSDELTQGIAYGEIPDYRDEALLTLVEKVPPEMPDNATLEQQEEHETALGEIKAERAKNIAEFIEKKAEERKAELVNVDIDQLREQYVHAVINIRCSEEFTRSFREYQIYKGTFYDSKFKKLAFDSFEEFDGAAPQLKSQLMVAYINLELTGEDLKN